MIISLEIKLYYVYGEICICYKWFIGNKKYRKYIESKATHDPVNFIKELDRYWRTDITQVMPEWKKVFDKLHWKQSDHLDNLNNVAEKYVNG